MVEHDTSLESTKLKSTENIWLEFWTRWLPGLQRKEGGCLCGNEDVVSRSSFTIKIHYSAKMKELAPGRILQYRGMSYRHRKWAENILNLSKELKSAALKSMQRLSAIGVLHGDVALQNVVQSKSSSQKAKIVDFSRSSVSSDQDLFQGQVKHLRHLLRIEWEPVKETIKKKT